MTFDLFVSAKLQQRIEFATTTRKKIFNFLHNGTLKTTKAPINQGFRQQKESKRNRQDSKSKCLKV
jgi:hypothetical protein